MKRAIMGLLILVVLLFSILIGAYHAKLAQANPYMYHEVVDPPSGSIPLVITVSSPANNATYNCSDIALTLNITTEDTSVNYLLDAFCTTSWASDNVTIYKQNTYSPEFPTFWEYSGTFHQLPDGEYSITVTARGGGGYADGLTYNFFDMTTVSAVNFRVDTTRPAVSQVSIENKTYDKSDLPLDFVTNESVSHVSYVLDGLESVTINGNTTLPELSEGVHNITVYATDTAGNTGVSDTTVFSIRKPKPFLTEPSVAAVAVTILTAIALAALVCVKKRTS